MMSKVEAMSVKTLAVSILIGAFCMSYASANAEGENAGAQAEVSQNIEPVSYTHLTLPTIYSV